MYQIAVKLGYDSPRTRIVALEAMNATKSFQLDVERCIVDFILGEKKKMELRNQSMLSIFLEKRKKRNSQVLYETTLYTSYEFSIFLFFFLNK